jgi:hypothetical protein
MIKMGTMWRQSEEIQKVKYCIRADGTEEEVLSRLNGGRRKTNSSHLISFRSSRSVCDNLLSSLNVGVVAGVSGWPCDRAVSHLGENGK